jgi:aspartate/methionine/tyrosine aminotransferase
LRLVPGPRFGAGANLENYLRLPFTLPEAELLDAVGRLAAARASLGQAAAAPPASTAQIA